MNRDEQLKRLSATAEYDVLIIGGGATGLGCAVDAASRGLKTLLLEKHDFAKGTSSRATKLVHGGVRYLAQGNLRLVREALLERGRLLQNAPHLCHRLAFVVPAYSRWQKYYYGIGLWVYDCLSFTLSLGRTRLLNISKTLDLVPNLSPQDLAGGVLYFDGQFDDSRLAINLAQTAVEHGATVLNYCGVTGFEKQEGKIIGVYASDHLNRSEFFARAKCVINATGVFGDRVLRMDDTEALATIAPSQGIHLVVDPQFFAGATALMIPKTDDGRVLFIIPWHNKLLVGTTDTPVNEVVTEPRALPEEIEFIISHFNRFSTTELTRRDVRSVFVGLRPLAKTGHQRRTSVMPRDHIIKVLPSGLVHVTGGKWTTYRHMAEQAIDQAVVTHQLPAAGGCQTKSLRIHGAEAASQVNQWDRGEFEHLKVYGTDAVRIQELIARNPVLADRIHPRHPYRIAEIQWCVENELACTVEDVLARRIRLLFLDARAAIESAPVVAKILAKQLRHDERWEEEQVAEFSMMAQGYLLDGEPSAET